MAPGSRPPPVPARRAPGPGHGAHRRRRGGARGRPRHRQPRDRGATHHRRGRPRHRPGLRADLPAARLPDGSASSRSCSTTSRSASSSSTTATPYDWTPDELELCATFASQMATAVANARLFNTVREGAARLRAIQELSSRLNRIQDVVGIGDAIVAEADRLIAHDTIRVYRVDHVTQLCEPIAFHGEFAGIGRPTADMLRLKVGEGLTGWVALHNRSMRLGDAASDPRGRQIGDNRGPESMLLVPMTYESRVLGVIVLSKAGYDQFGDDDERTLEIFAGYAAQALVNAEAFGQVRRQQQELHHRLESQRRLLEVNERLLATLDPSGVLEMIADSLKTVVSYDSLTIYRVDRAAGVRRAVVARDRFAELILSHEGALDVGITGWVIRNGEAVLANDAHLDHAVDPDPGHARGAGVDGRVPAARGRRGHRHAQPRADGRRGGALLARRVRARPAVRGPGVHRPAQRRGARRGGDESGARRPDRPAQPRRLPAGPRRPRRQGAAVHAADARPRRVQGLQRLARTPGRGRAARPDRRRHGRVHPRRRPRLPLRRRRVRGPPAGRHLDRGT